MTPGATLYNEGKGDQGGKEHIYIHQVNKGFSATYKGPAKCGTAFSDKLEIPMCQVKETDIKF